MFDAIGRAITGMNDAVLRVVNATSNIVNASSTTASGEKFRPTSVSTESVSIGGVDMGVHSEIQQRPLGSEVDLASEMVDITVAVVAYDANAAVIKAVADVEKKLIDSLT